MSRWENVGSVSEMVGAIITEIQGSEEGSEKMTFVADDGREFDFYHEQDCCESVRLYDVTGDLSDLIGLPLVMAEEVSSEPDPEGVNTCESCTWTFYKFATVKGYVTARWLGESNGYYSESVDFTVRK